MKKMMKAAVCGLALVASLGLGVIAEAGRIPSHMVPLQTYATKKVTCYMSPGGAAKGWIDPGDYVIVNQIRSDGWAYGSYPVRSGRTSRWFRIDDLLNNPGFTTLERMSPSYKINVYKNYSYKGTIGSVWGNENIWVVSNLGDVWQIVYKVNSGGYKMGWVPYWDCLEKPKPTPAQGATAGMNAAISSQIKVALNVGSLKQKDSRWKNVYVGTKTIGSIGCTITSLTMKYNYHNKTNITPADMKNKLKFNNNSIYWSSVNKLGYTTDMPPNRPKLDNTWMKKIYQQLKKGKPVIVGAYKAKDNQHWVVVTGYNGNSNTNFSAINFTINDPDYPHTNLQQFINVYPYGLRGIIY